MRDGGAERQAQKAEKPGWKGQQPGDSHCLKVWRGQETRKPCH